jgi:hypothetical protein
MRKVEGATMKQSGGLRVRCIFAEGCLGPWATVKQRLTVEAEVSARQAEAAAPDEFEAAAKRLGPAKRGKGGAP